MACCRRNGLLTAIRSDLLEGLTRRRVTFQTAIDGPLDADHGVSVNQEQTLLRIPMEDIMIRAKLLILVVAATTTTCLWASSVAFATFEKTSIKCESGIPTACLAATEGGSKFEAKGKETYTGKLVPGTEASLDVPSIALDILCKKDASTGEVEQTEPLVNAVVARNGILTFSECHIAGEVGTKCRVTEPIKTKPLKGTVIDEMPISAGTVEPETGKTIAEVEIGNQAGQTCPATIKGINPVKGSDLCVSAEAEVDKVVHTGECRPEGSKLEFGANRATFECRAEAELTSKSLGDVSLA
jgi:hypothetical protein